MDNFLQLVQDYGYWAIFFLLVFGIVGLPIPDETMLTFAGYLVYKGHLQLFPAILVAFIGTTCGITTSYFLGRTVGLRLVHKYGRYVHITEERLNRVHNWFERVGKWSLTFGYFIPGVRHLTALVAGSSKLEFHMFCLFAYTGGFVWSTTFILLGYFLGEGWALVEDNLRHTLLAAFGLLAVCVLVLVIVHQRIRSRRSTNASELANKK